MFVDEFVDTILCVLMSVAFILSMKCTHVGLILKRVL